MNLASNEWDPELCRIFDVPLECLPAIRSTVGSFGSIDGLPICANVVDQQAALYGHGCRLMGDAKITFGTGAFMLGITGTAMVSKPKSGLLPTPAWKIEDTTTFALDGGVFHAGAALEWASRVGFLENFTALGAFASAPAISRGLAFVPALTGLGCPHWDQGAAALWIGMSPGTSRLDLCQSILEGIALRTAEVISAMAQHLPLREEIHIDGGLSHSPYFVQFLADVSRRRIVVKTSSEVAAFGCAGLAALGIGHSIALPSNQAVYSPRDVEYETWIQQFTDAVARAKRWR